MACACQGKPARMTYTWTSDDGSESLTYATEIQAKAKVLRDGGSYVAVV